MYFEIHGQENNENLILEKFDPQTENLQV